MKSLSLYIHVPFCEKKCYYCDFNSYSGQNDKIDRYVEALKKEMFYYQSQLSNYKIKTIFWGGGTPSLLEGKYIREIMEILKKNFLVDDQAEISIEVNPGTLTSKKLKDYFDAGINRLSIGLQACQSHLLKSLGRIHDFQDFIINLDEARKIGFKNINVDLMFALPGQSEKNWRDSLKQIVDLEIPHISAYSLIIEEETPFYNWVKDKKITLLDEDTELSMYHYAIDYLQKKGYIHYEISNYAQVGYECQHNLVYWHNQFYLGLGPGAHSYIEKNRYYNVKRIDDYIKQVNKGKSPIEKCIPISLRDEISETMFLGLRLMQGISIQTFTERFKVSPFEIYKEQLLKLKKQGLIQYNNKNIALTSKGIDLSNIVFQEMLLD